MNGNIAVGGSCDWCNGTLRPFPQAKSGVRCESCWRTEGSDDAPYSIKNKRETLRKLKESEK